MLKREDILKILKEANLPNSEYWVTSGAGLVLYGVKETTRDIDLGCTPKLIDFYISQGCKCRNSIDHSRIVELDYQIELIENWFSDQIEFIEGFPIASLKSIRNQKMNLGRPKDFEDIKRIDEFLCNTEPFSQS